MKCSKCGKFLELRKHNPWEDFKYPWLLANGNDFWYCGECGILIHEESEF